MLRTYPAQMTQWEPLSTQGLATYTHLLTDLSLTEELDLSHESCALDPHSFGYSPLLEEGDLVLENISQWTQARL